MGVRTVDVGVKMPVPLLNHATVLEGLVMPPARLMLPVEQTVWLGPAVTVAIFVMAIITVSLTAGQGPLLVEVSVKMTVPVLISAPVVP